MDAFSSIGIAEAMATAKSISDASQSVVQMGKQLSSPFVSKWQRMRAVFLSEIEKNPDLSLEEKIYCVNHMNTFIKSCRNQDSIKEKAFKKLRGDKADDKVEDISLKESSLYEENAGNLLSSIREDWLMFFFDYAKNVSNEGFQEIWACVLAEEAKHAGTISRRLIVTLSLLDSDDAETFGRACRTVFECSNPNMSEESQSLVLMPFALPEKYNTFSEKSLSCLCEANLLEKRKLTCSDDLYVNTHKGFLHSFSYYTNVTSPEETPTIYRFTETGNELCKLLNLERDADFWERCFPF